MEICEYEDWDSLVTAIENKIPDMLEKYIAPVGEEILRRHIITDIYGQDRRVNGGRFGGITFTSKYDRRYNLSKSVYSTISRSGDVFELLITSDEEANTPVLSSYSWTNKYPGAFLEFIEKGGEDGGFGLWKKGFPRPAVSLAQKEIDTSSAISKALRDAIQAEIKI